MNTEETRGLPRARTPNDSAADANLKPGKALPRPLSTPDARSWGGTFVGPHDELVKSAPSAPADLPETWLGKQLSER